MTPDDLRRKAAALEQQGNALLAEGKPNDAAARFVEAAVFHGAADEMERIVKARGLRGRNNPRIVPEGKVTTAQLKRRGAAVARGWAAKTRNPVAIAITSSAWGSTTRYARERLGISQPALSRYMSGGLPCPRDVADAVKADFGLDHRVWPAGVVD